ITKKSAPVSFASSRSATWSSRTFGTQWMRSPGKVEKHLGWGGRREGAGRKPTGRAGVPHRAREAHDAAHPVCITLRVIKGVPNLRSKKMFHQIWIAVKCGSLREGFRIVHFSVEPDRMNLIVEANTDRALQRGIQGFSIRLARGINVVLGRKGK